MKIKATRGDVNCFRADNDRNEESFKAVDINLVADTRLVEQNVDMPTPIPNNKQGAATLYRESLPTGTFHQYCKNFAHGSLNGTDGILAYFLQKVPCANYYHAVLDDFYGVPCMMETMQGLVEDCKIYTSNSFCKTKSLSGGRDDAHAQKYDVLISSWTRWVPLKITYYHEKDAKILILEISPKLDDYITAVRQALLRKYTPVAFCKNVMIAIQSNIAADLRCRGDSFPFILSHRVNDYLSLFTNLYLGPDDKWYSLRELEIEVGHRNFLLQFGTVPQSSGDEIWVSEHVRLNQRLIWKPLIAGRMEK